MNNLDIIKALSNGINPITGESISKDSLLNDQVIVRALNSATEVMKADKINQENILLKDKKKQENNVISGRLKNHGLSWSEELVSKLVNKFKNGSSIPELSDEFQRTISSIESKLFDAGLIKDENLSYRSRSTNQNNRNTANISSKTRTQENIIKGDIGLQNDPFNEDLP